MDNALLQTLVWAIVGAIITVFTRRQGNPALFEQRLNGNGKQRSTGELEILRHTETAQDDRLASIERNIATLLEAQIQQMRDRQMMNDLMTRWAERIIVLEDCCAEQKSQSQAAAKTDIQPVEPPADDAGEAVA